MRKLGSTVVNLLGQSVVRGGTFTRSDVGTFRASPRSWSRRIVAFAAAAHLAYNILARIG